MRLCCKYRQEVLVSGHPRARERSGVGEAGAAGANEQQRKGSVCRGRSPTPLIQHTNSHPTPRGSPRRSVRRSAASLPRRWAARSWWRTRRSASTRCTACRVGCMHLQIMCQVCGACEGTALREGLGFFSAGCHAWSKSFSCAIWGCICAGRGVGREVIPAGLCHMSRPLPRFYPLGPTVCPGPPLSCLSTPCHACRPLHQVVPGQAGP